MVTRSPRAPLDLPSGWSAGAVGLRLGTPQEYPLTTPRAPIDLLQGSGSPPFGVVMTTPRGTLLSAHKVLKMSPFAIQHPQTSSLSAPERSDSVQKS